MAMLSTGGGTFPQIRGTYPQFGGLGRASLSKQLTQNVGCLPDISDSNPTNYDESAQWLIHSLESGCGFKFFVCRRGDPPIIKQGNGGFGRVAPTFKSFKKRAHLCPSRALPELCHPQKPSRRARSPCGLCPSPSNLQRESNRSG